MDLRHDSYRCARYLALAPRHRVATVFTDADDHPSFADQQRAPAAAMAVIDALQSPR